MGCKKIQDKKTQIRRGFLGPSCGAHRFPRNCPNLLPGLTCHYTSGNRGLLSPPSHLTGPHKPHGYHAHVPPDEEASDGRMFLCLWQRDLSTLIPERYQTIAAHLEVASVAAAEEREIWTHRETPHQPPFSLTSWPLLHPLVACESRGPEGHTLSATLLSLPVPGQASTLCREHISSITPPSPPLTLML